MSRPSDSKVIKFAKNSRHKFGNTVAFILYSKLGKTLPVKCVSYLAFAHSTVVRVVSYNSYWKQQRVILIQNESYSVARFVTSFFANFITFQSEGLDT